MQSKFTIAALVFSLTITALSAQVPKDATVPLTATIGTNPASITLNWANPAASTLLILRRTKGQAGNQWIQLLNVTNSTQTSLTDNNVALSQTYEYRIQRISNITAHGYAHVAIEAPVTDSRGKVLLFTDADIVAPLATELERLKNDLAGDGWQIVEHFTDAAATVQSVKNQIVADYNADPANVKAVFLLGKIPVPYSGNSAWDGHSDHAGAWPCDAYYADVNGNWTDATVFNVSPARVANRNIPNDGKFDQSTIPSPVELQVGRVDFRRLTEGTFGATTVELLRRYLDKNHNWRTGAYTVENKALVDDNFGYFSGEAFAANGFRNAYPLVGEANIVEADFFDNTSPQTYLLGYGTGGGTYTSAGGVGNSTNFATDTVNIVFSNLFGSYHGDWDFETNPFMPSSLASRGGIITCAWAGRPHHFNQALASGETIGYCMKETQNAQYNSGFFQSLVGEGGAHMALLGDPTLRAHVVAPPTDVAAISGCGKVLLNWTASPDAAVSGYHVYRSFSKYGDYTRLTANAVTGTVFTDGNVLIDTIYYQVRTVKMQTSPGGGTYFNTSTGTMTSLIYAPAVPPAVTIDNDGGVLTCIKPTITLKVVSDPPGVLFQWSGTGGGAISTPGVYTVTVTFANGCTNTASTIVVQDATTPTAAVSDGIITCANPTVALEGSSSTPNAAFQWTGPCLLPPGNIACAPGVYTLTVTNFFNGCTSTATAVVYEDVTPPSIPAIADVTITCYVQSVILDGTVSVSNATYQWSGPCITAANVYLPAPMISCPGVYTLTVTNAANGCTSTTTVTVTEDTEPPGATIGFNGGGILTCQMPTIQLMGNSPMPNVSYMWSGPGGFVSFQQNVEVALPGTYLLTVINPANGCTSTASITIETDGSLPNASAQGGTLTCTNPTVQLNGGSTTLGVTFFWTGPNGFVSMLEDPIVSFPGTYTLTVVAPNGCSVQTSAIVQLDVEPPVVVIAPYGQLTCNNPCVTINYSWSGMIESLTVCVPGTYTITVTGANGCTALLDFTVEQELWDGFINVTGTPESAPGASDGSIDVTIVGGNPPFDFLWSNGATTEDLANIPGGTYTVTITDAGGCTALASITVDTILNTNETDVFQELLLSPNPTEGLTLLSIKLHKAAPIRIAIHDAMGRLVWEKPEVVLQETQTPLDLRKSPPGMYSVFIFVENEVFVRKMTVVR